MKGTPGQNKQQNKLNKQKKKSKSNGGHESGSNSLLSNLHSFFFLVSNVKQCTETWHDK